MSMTLEKAILGLSPSVGLTATGGLILKENGWMCDLVLVGLDTHNNELSIRRTFFGKTI